MRRATLLLALATGCTEPVVGFRLDSGAGGGVGGGGGGSTDCDAGCCRDDDCPPTGDACVAHLCQQGACVQVARDALCDDGLACTVSDRCTAGRCMGEPTTCKRPEACFTLVSCVPCTMAQLDAGSACPDDGDPCTTDVCSEDGGCTHEAVTCANAPSCFIGPGKCGADGGCEFTMTVDAGSACDDDQNECTGDTCDSTGTCRHEVLPDDTLCAADALPCTLDVCRSGECRHVTNCGPPNVCQLGVGTCMPTGCTYGSVDAGIGCGMAADDCHVRQCNGYGVCSTIPIDGGCTDQDGLSCTLGLCTDVGDDIWACRPTDTCTGGRICGGPGCLCGGALGWNGTACVSCSVQSTGVCGVVPECDGAAIDIPEGGASPVVFQARCRASRGICSASNAWNGTALTTFYSAGAVYECVKRDGVYGWHVRHSSVSQGGPGCLVGDPHCTVICSQPAGYEAFCSAAGNWETNLGNLVADGCPMLPAAYQCP